MKHKIKLAKLLFYSFIFAVTLFLPVANFGQLLYLHIYRSAGTYDPLYSILFFKIIFLQ